MSLCKAIKSDGTPCNAPVAEGREYCFHHDPDRTEEASQARQKGCTAAREAKRRANRDANRPPLKTFRLKSLEDVRRLLEATVNDFRTRLINADEARCLAYVANILIGSIKDGEIESRLKELEDRVAARKEEIWGA